MTEEKLIIMNAWNDPAELRAFLARFDHMFPLQGVQRRRAYLFFKGWTPAFAGLCERIDTLLGTDKRSFEWTRVREKFGAPSLAYRMEGQARFAVNSHRPAEVTRVPCEPIENFDPVAVAIQEQILQAEAELRTLCIICGGRSTITNAQGPWVSLCAEHQAAVFPHGLNDRAGPVWMAAELEEGTRPDDQGE